MSQVTRVLIADDHGAIREGLTALLVRESDFEIVGAVGDGQKAVGLAERTRPDVVVIDVRMPICDGVEATRRIVSLDPRCRVLAYSWCEEEDSIQGMVEAGVSGYLLKSCAPAEVVQAIRKIRTGQVYFSDEVQPVAQRAMDRLNEPRHGAFAGTVH